MSKHCCIPECSSVNTTASLYRIPAKRFCTGEKYKWAEDLEKVILAIRDDPFIKNLYKRDNVRICHRHFIGEDIQKKGTRLELKLGALPRLNMPMKSVPVTKSTGRPSPRKRKLISHSYNQNLDDVSFINVPDLAKTKEERCHREHLTNFLLSVMDPSKGDAIEQRLKKETAAICEIHFREEDIIRVKSKSLLKLGARPCKFGVQFTNPDNNSDRSCVAYGCNKRRKKRGREIRSDSDGSDDEESEMKRKYPRRFHLFPIEPQLLKQWIVNIRRKDWFPNPSSKICSDHFKEEDLDRSGSIVRLKKNAVPTRFKALKKLLTYDDDSETCSTKLEPPKLINIKQEP